MAMEIPSSMEIMALLEAFTLSFLGISGLLMAGAGFFVIDIGRRPEVGSVAGTLGSAGVFVLLLGVISFVAARVVRGRMAQEEMSRSHS